MKRSLIMLIISTFLIQATVFADETSDPSSLKQKIKITLSGKDFDWPDWDMFRGDRDISDLLNIATTAPEPNGTMFFHADIPDTILNAGPVDAQIFYGGGSNWGFNDAYFLGTTGYENTFESFAPMPGSGQFDIGVQATLTYEGAEATVSQGPYNSSNSDPAPYYLSVCDEPSGDQNGGSNFDITDVSISFTDSRVFVKLTNAGGGFPVGGFFGPWNVYVVGFLNPEDEDQTLYGLGYGDGAFGLLYPGLWKFEADSDFPEIIGNINYSISGNNLYMSANWNDIFSDPAFGPWPNEYEFLGMAGITIEASLDAFNFQDQTDAIVFNPSIQSFTIGQNTAPSLSDHGFEITGNSGGLYDVAFHCNYSDEDNHFPLISEIIIDNEIVDTLTSGDHNYADGSIFTVQASLAPGSHTYEMSFSDGMSDVGTGEVSFTVGSSENVEYTFANAAGWNMVGLSVGVEDGSVYTIFPNATDGTLYSFDGGYASETELTPGSGYWLRFDDSGETTVSGQSIGELSISISEGWNMIAGISSSVAVSSISDPDDLIVPGTIYGFDDGYFESESIEPGRGYWLRALQDGVVSLIVGGAPGSVNYSNEIQPIFNNNCTSCHVNGGGYFGGLDLSTFDNLMLGNSNNGPVVTPGDGAGSYIIQKLEGTAPGLQMPAYADPLSSDLINLISQWIDEGAMNNRDNLSKVGTNQIQRANTLYINGLKLFFGIDLSDRERLSFSLPPKPPAGAFDVRFEGDWKYINDFGKMELLANSDYVNVDYVIHNDEIWQLIDSQNGSMYDLTGSGTVVISGNSTNFNLRKVESLPNQYTLSQNYPNPFNPVTFITYTVPEMSYIAVLVYNLAGQEINELVSEIKAPGQYSISWDGTDNRGNPVASGVYFYQFHGNGFSDMQKMILMK